MDVIKLQLAEALCAILPYAMNEGAAIHDCARKDGSEEAEQEAEIVDASIDLAIKALAAYDAEYRPAEADPTFVIDYSKFTIAQTKPAEGAEEVSPVFSAALIETRGGEIA